MKEESAFPHSEEEDGYVINNPGMSLRDFFAANAMPSLICNPFDPEMIAKKSYLIADAMLKASQS